MRGAPELLTLQWGSRYCSPVRQCVRMWALHLLSKHPSGEPVFDIDANILCPQIGPRMELEVVKVEEGLCAGRVLFHAHRSKTREEADAQEGEVVEKERLRSERRRQQVRAWRWLSGSVALPWDRRRRTSSSESKCVLKPCGTAASKCQHAVCRLEGIGFRA